MICQQILSILVLAIFLLQFLFLKSASKSSFFCLIRFWSCNFRRHCAQFYSVFCNLVSAGRTGVCILSRPQLLKLIKILRAHHSRDPGFLRTIAMAADSYAWVCPCGCLCGKRRIEVAASRLLGAAAACVILLSFAAAFVNSIGVVV